MPKSQPPREKKSGRGQLQIRQVLEKANSVDRRRRAQIDNQKGAIARLLEALNNHQPVDKAITREMEVLHQGAAELRAQRDEALERVAELEKALSDAQTLEGAQAG
jgi:TorA maturation chaperone TorD